MLPADSQDCPCSRAVTEKENAVHQGIGIAVLTVVTIGLCACVAREDPAPDAAVAAEAASPEPRPEFNPVATTAVLMRGTVSMAAEDYWNSVSIVIDLEGEHENFPQTEAEWERVWAAGITLAETGNLLRMPPRYIDDPDWMRLTQAMIDTGLAAQDYMAVLDAGEEVYNVCSECHEIFFPSLQI
jgi:hypothetical protein